MTKPPAPPSESPMDRIRDSIGGNGAPVRPSTVESPAAAHPHALENTGTGREPPRASVGFWLLSAVLLLFGLGMLIVGVNSNTFPAGPARRGSMNQPPAPVPGSARATGPGDAAAETGA
ncbi:MAG TPA: hypothetical protein VL860_10570, partial [Planctomycetota bacterium]|nr:hypothetical protein [Planctomycetota bacterium]